MARRLRSVRQRPARRRLLCGAADLPGAGMRPRRAGLTGFSRRGGSWACGSRGGSRAAGPRPGTCSARPRGGGPDSPAVRPRPAPPPQRPAWAHLAWGWPGAGGTARRVAPTRAPRLTEGSTLAVGGWGGRGPSRTGSALSAGGRRGWTRPPRAAHFKASRWWGQRESETGAGGGGQVSGCGTLASLGEGKGQPQHQITRRPSPPFPVPPLHRAAGAGTLPSKREPSVLRQPGGALRPADWRCWSPGGAPKNSEQSRDWSQWGEL